MSATTPLVTNTLFPFRTQESPRRTAVVSIFPPSLPAFGSATATAYIFSPAHGGKVFLLLFLVGRIGQDGPREHGILGDGGEAQARPRHLLQHEDPGKHPEPQAAVFLGNHLGQQPQGRHLFVDLVRIFPALIIFQRLRATSPARRIPWPYSGTSLDPWSVENFTPEKKPPVKKG